MVVKTKIGEGGRIVIPGEYRKALGIKQGDMALMVREEKVLTEWSGEP